MLNCSHIFDGTLNYHVYNLFLTLFVIVLSAVFYTRVKSFFPKIVGIPLIFLGAFGNIYEREFMYRGCVKDPFNFFNFFHFNVYDVLICIGVAVLTWSVYTLPNGKDGNN